MNYLAHCLTQSEISAAVVILNEPTKTHTLEFPKSKLYNLSLAGFQYMFRRNPSRNLSKEIIQWKANSLCTKIIIAILVK